MLVHLNFLLLLFSLSLLYFFCLFAFLLRWYGSLFSLFFSGPHGNVEFTSKLLRQVYRWQSFLLVSRLRRALMHGWRFVRIHEVCVNSFEMIFSPIFALPRHNESWMLSHRPSLSP